MASPVAGASIPPPVILAPAEISEHRGFDEIEVRWEEVPQASYYRITLARDRRFRRVVFQNDKVPGTLFLVEGLDYGTYFLKIESLDDRGRPGKASEVRTFIMVPPSPTTTFGRIP